MLKPLADKVIVKPSEEKEETTASGIVLNAESKQSRHREGVVLAVGRGRLSEPDSADVAGVQMKHWSFIPMEVKAGDTVVYTFGDEFVIAGEKVVILREQDILAVIEK